MPEADGDLRDILRALGRSRARFVVIGGFAMQLHGSSYVTFDLDLAFERTRENAEVLAHALRPFAPRARAFPVDMPFRVDAQTILASEIIMLTTSAGDVDLLGLVKGVGGYAQVVALAELIPFENFEIWILGINGLLQAKRAANRPKDAAGLIELEAMQEARAFVDRANGNDAR